MHSRLFSGSKGSVLSSGSRKSRYTQGGV